MTWFDDLRQQWRPSTVRILLIGESAPDSPASPEQRRFFYAPKVSRYDNLFRGVIGALYDGKVSTGDDRTPWLQRLYDDGVYLIDLVPYPVNGLPSVDRAQARVAHVESCIAEARNLAPSGVIVCHAPSFKLLASALRRERLPLLHQAPIPFPLGNHRAAFVSAVRGALSALVPPDERPGTVPES